MDESDRFDFVVCGNPSTCRTEVEVSFDSEVVALVYESPTGWRTELLGLASSNPKLAGLAQAVESARERLSHFVNRVGRGAPAGLDPMGLSLWLMQRDDSDQWSFGR